MCEHPEHELIKILISGDIAGLDEDTYPKWKAARDKISPEGYEEYKRQSSEISAELKEMFDKEQREWKLLHLAIDNGVRH